MPWVVLAKRRADRVLSLFFSAEHGDTRLCFGADNTAFDVPSPGVHDEVAFASLSALSSHPLFVVVVFEGDRYRRVDDPV